MERTVYDTRAWRDLPRDGDDASPSLDKRRGGRPRLTHCARGHPFDESNTYVSPQGLRYCRACGAENSRKRRREGAGRPEGWKATRKRVLERDAYTCAVGLLFGLEDECSDVLDVHHRKARRSGGTNDDENLYVLCRRHHSMVEAMLRRLERGEEITSGRLRRCAHDHRYPGAREACERRLNDVVAA
jgi:5-methylcytosine-specific restriction endonuclease McrA